MKRAIASMLIGDDRRYLIYVKVLLDSLLRTDSFRHGVDFVLICKTSLPLSEELRVYRERMPKGSQLHLRESKLDDFPTIPDTRESPVTLQKLNMFAWTEFTRVMFIDPDCFAEKNLDPLWTLPIPCFTLMREFPFATSMMLIRPDMGDFELFTETARRAQFDTLRGWDFVGQPPVWPDWHKRLFGEDAPYPEPESREREPWKFAYAATEDGIFLRHLYMQGRPQYSDGFDGIFHLSARGNKNGAARERMLLEGLSEYYLEAATRAGLRDELLDLCRARAARGEQKELGKF